jgi:hypothetical protein
MIAPELTINQKGTRKGLLAKLSVELELIFPVI